MVDSQGEVLLLQNVPRPEAEPVRGITGGGVCDEMHKFPFLLKDLKFNLELNQVGFIGSLSQKVLLAPIHNNHSIEADFFGSSWIELGGGDVSGEYLVKKAVLRFALKERVEAPQHLALLLNNDGGGLSWMNLGPHLIRTHRQCQRVFFEAC